MFIRLNPLFFMNPSKLIVSFSRAFQESHDYKPPLEKVRSPIFGRLLAGWIFIWRITSVFQFIKAIYKTLVYYVDGDQEEIQPILAELYIAGTLACHLAPRAVGITARPTGARARATRGA